MSELIKATYQLCRKCKYGMWISGGTGGHDICCGYALDVVHSRTLEDGKPRIPAGYCDKYKCREGKIISRIGGGHKWTADDMTLNTKKAIKARKEHERRTNNDNEDGCM